jgi:hypothetical protein
MLSTIRDLPETTVAGGASDRAEHEIVNHLHACQGFMELLSLERAGPLNEKQRRYLMKAIDSLQAALGRIRGQRDKASWPE